MKELEVVGERVAYTGSRISIIEREFIDRKGARQVYEVVRSNRGKYVVNILAVTPDSEVVLISQQRICLVRDNVSDITERHLIRTIELPGGVVGAYDGGYSLRGKAIEVARQELREETGYEVRKDSKVSVLASNVPCNVGRYEMETILLFALVEKAGEPKPEESEALEVFTVSFSALPTVLCHESFSYVDTRVWAAYGIAKHRGLI